MPTFDDWYDWASGQGQDWDKVAANARREARYEAPDGMRVFQDSIADDFPQSPADYQATCLPHHLSGEEVATEHLPTGLTRMVGSSGLEGALDGAIGGSTLPRPRPAPISEAHWTRISDLLPSREDADEALFVPAKPVDVDDPAGRAVFAAFDEEDELPAGGPPQSRFLERLRADRGTAMTVADYAVYQLATDPRPQQNQALRVQVLLCYPRQGIGAPLYPVPPDACWHPRFRAIAASDPHYCGRTFPDGAAPGDHASGLVGENEIVHRNEGIACDEIYVISLGSTSCAGSRVT